MISYNEVGSTVILSPCTGGSKEKWKHKKGGQIVHIESGMCLDITDVKHGEYAKINKCDSNKLGQFFEFENYSP
jgi:hypothetical protein